MLKELKQTYLKNLKIVSFDASYYEHESDSTFDIKIAQKNTSLGSIDDVGYSKSDRITFVMGEDQAQGFIPQINNRILIESDSYNIEKIEKLRVGPYVVGFEIEVSS